jgi:hypothetical protein
MTTSQFLICLVVGALSAGIMRAIVAHSPRWVLASAVFGFAGALLGVATGDVSQLAGILGIDLGGRSLDIAWPLAGGTLLVIWAIAGQALLSSLPAYRESSRQSLVASRHPIRVSGSEPSSRTAAR